jgi:hypothetical protein
MHILSTVLLFVESNANFRLSTLFWNVTTLDLFLRNQTKYHSLQFIVSQAVSGRLHQESTPHGAATGRARAT